MRWINLMWILVCLSASAFIIKQSGALSDSKTLPFEPTDFNNIFSVDVFSVATIAVTGAGVFGALISLIFKQYIYAAGILLCFVMTVFMAPVREFLFAFPMMIQALLPAELAWFAAIPYAFMAISTFIFLAELLSQRSLN